uniref:Fe2OG dioxygenase domain-containing protein n=1 Tax=Oryza punctata TaxID=4537 RepID=A0A0E0KLQ8_ORYPU
MESSSSEKPRNLGGSLPVPNVQDLAARPDDLTLTILRRYLRPHQLATGTHHQLIPVVDLGRLLDHHEHEEEAAKLSHACQDWGFFQVVNHGISDDTLEEMKRDVMAFFNLPLPDKTAFAQQPEWIEGYGQAFVTSEDQTLDWSDLYFLTTQPPTYRDLRFWPPEPSTFRRSMDRYSVETQRVATELLRAMARNLGLRDADEMTRLAAAQSMRMNYYPPCPAKERDRVLGVSPHSDAVGLTLLLQVSPVQGLQIRKGGAWIPVDPIPGALVANVGDVIEVVTNGRYKSIEHRVVVDAAQERVSVAAFHTATFGSTYGPLEEMVGGGEARYRSISVEDYVRLVVSSKLEGKNILDAIKIN